MPELLSLTLALLGLIAAPLLYGLLRRSPPLVAALNGFVFTSIALLVLGEILPASLHAAGWRAGLAFGGGLVLPLVVEGLSRRGAMSPFALGLALVALLLHSLLDGIGLRAGSGHHPELSAAIVLHKLPVGLMIWWLVRPRFGAAFAYLTLVAIALATLGGFAFDLGSWDGPAVALFTAFVGGALLHVVAISHGPDLGRRMPLMELVGAGLGVGAVWLISGLGDGHGGVDDPSGGWGALLDRALALGLETAPALALGFVLAGVVSAVLPRMNPGILGGGGPWAQAGKGVLFGLPLPICSCGVVPIYDALVKRGVPAAAAMAFLVATPELGIDSLLLSLPLLGGELTAYRVASAFILAIAVGALVGPMADRRGRAAPQVAPEASAERGDVPMKDRLFAGLRFGLVDVVDDTAPWILGGLLIAALVDPGALGPLLEALPPGGDVLGAALLGLPIYVCASGATPLAAALLLAGISPGAALAFLLAGPATNVTTFGVLSRAHGRGVALAFGGGMFALAVLLGFGVNALASGALGGAALSEAAAAPSLLEYGCLVFVLTLFAASLGRQGPRAFLATFLSLGMQEEGGEDPEDGPAAGPGPNAEAGAAEGGGSCCQSSCGESARAAVGG